MSIFTSLPDFNIQARYSSDDLAQMDKYKADQDKYNKQVELYNYLVTNDQTNYQNYADAMADRRRAINANNDDLWQARRQAEDLYNQYVPIIINPELNEKIEAAEKRISELEQKELDLSRNRPQYALPGGVPEHLRDVKIPTNAPKLDFTQEDIEKFQADAQSRAQTRAKRMNTALSVARERGYFAEGGAVGIETVHEPSPLLRALMSVR